MRKPLYSQASLFLSTVLGSIFSADQVLLRRFDPFYFLNYKILAKKHEKAWITAMSLSGGVESVGFKIYRIQLL